MGWLAMTVRGLLVVLALWGCNDTVLFGPPTESTCPTDSTLTYATFGQPFMESYCVRCHSSTLMGSARMGAPLLHDFNTLPGITIFISHIDETAAAGPAATNTSMPNGDPTPSLAERTMLGEWLACGAPP
jgi:hypothetical protein